MLKTVVLKLQIAWLLARSFIVDPMPVWRLDIASASIKPYIVVRRFRVWTTRFYIVIICYKPLKHVVDVLICDDRQRGVHAATKLSRFIPT